MIDTNDSSKCCGCGICASVCPSMAIEIVKDHFGFERAQISMDSCIRCSRCVSVCPIQGEKNLSLPKKAFVIQNKDFAVRRDSTSGGAFTPFAKAVLENDGVVYGVVMNEKMAEHSRALDIVGVSKMRNSKYTQSSMCAILNDKSLEQDVYSGKIVLFSGTPCQVNAVKKKFPKSDNLITIEVMCREVVTPMLFEKYIEYMEVKGKKTIESVRFRDKHYGYHYSTMNVNYSDGTKYFKPLNYDPYLRAFFSNAYARESCTKCPYRGIKRGADITIWDAWNIKSFKRLMVDDYGATNILINSERGEKIFDSCRKELYFEECTIHSLVGNAKDMEKQISMPGNAEEMREDLVSMGAEAFFEKYWPVTAFMKFRNCIKTALYKNVVLGKLFK